MEITTETKREYIVNIFLERDILISGDFVELLNDAKIIDRIYDILQKTDNIDKDFLSDELLKYKSEKKINNDVILKFNYQDEPQKKKIDDFISYFRQRFKSLELLLRQRHELQNVVSINRLLNKKEREKISLIGLVKDKRITKNGNFIITLEDPTASINVIVNKTKQAIFEQAKNIVNDEVIGINGVNGDKIIFADNVIFPDIPLTKELKKAPYEKYAVFISDIHVGSTFFLKDNFLKFIKWIRGEIGTDEQKKIASKISYIFIMGDIVDGIGIYPGQEKELEITDIYQQYEECAKYLAMVPSNIKMIICPGNHDAMRIAEPQPPIYEDLAEDIYKLPNAIMVSNPAIVNVGRTDDFEGFDVLLYHGYSFDYYMANVEMIRNNGGYDRADLMMKFLLQKRHLAPSYSSTLFIPTPDKDNLIISNIPDFFATGHIHKCSIPLQKNINYRNVTLISGSCWQSTTPFQVKVGHNPEPARVPIVNLQTREVKILNFDKV